MKKITVFCGSTFGADEDYKLQAHLLGQALSKQNITLVYGGAKVGLMGAVADGVLSKEGKVIGVLPQFLKDKEVAHEGLSELILVENMHERKIKLNELCDGFIALPGGFGTLEELFEVISWGQLQLHNKPVGILNVAGFYDELMAFMNTMTEKGFLNKKFLKNENKQTLFVSSDIDDLLQQMQKSVEVLVAQ